MSDSTALVPVEPAASPARSGQKVGKGRGASSKATHERHRREQGHARHVGSQHKVFLMPSGWVTYGRPKAICNALKVGKGEADQWPAQGVLQYAQGGERRRSQDRRGARAPRSTAHGVLFPARSSRLPMSVVA